MRVHNLIREQPWYRREAFDQGVRMAGHEVVRGTPGVYDMGTAVIIWNRYGQWHEIACRVEAGGGVVLVAENGYLGKDGVSPKFDVYPNGPKPESYYALSRGWHNSQREPGFSTGERRFDALGVRVKEWRTEGDYVLVCPNRSFGVGDRAMPVDWPVTVVKSLAKKTTRPIKLRDHPGANFPAVPLAADLAGAVLVVVWSSTCGVHALVEGVPVVCCAPDWICKGASFGTLDTQYLTGWKEQREVALNHMALSQWSCEEISNGTPFRYLLPHSR